MPSLSELQRRFAKALLATDADPGERIAVYRNTVFANYRNALGATYRVVRELTGTPFFNAAVDAYVLAYPSTGGDLNVYGDRFGAFLDDYPYARDVRYLPDVARLEWAIDEAQRARDADGAPGAVLGALSAVAPERLTHVRFALDPSCRLLESEYPVLRIWQMHQSGADDVQPASDAGADRLLIRREAGAVVVERVTPADFAWLGAFAANADLTAALDAALAVDETFDLGPALRTYVANGTLVDLCAS